MSKASTISTSLAPSGSSEPLISISQMMVLESPSLGMPHFWVWRRMRSDEAAIDPPGRSTITAVPFTGKDTVDEVVACTAFVRTVPWPMMLWWSFAYSPKVQVMVTPSPAGTEQSTTGTFSSLSMLKVSVELPESEMIASSGGI